MYGASRSYEDGFAVSELELRADRRVAGSARLSDGANDVGSSRCCYFGLKYVLPVMVTVLRAIRAGTVISFDIEFTLAESLRLTRVSCLHAKVMLAIPVLTGIRVDAGFIACRTISSGNSSGSCGLTTSHECLSQNGQTAAGHGSQHTESTRR